MRNIALTLGALLPLASTAAVSAQQITAEQESALRVEVEGFMDAYYANWSRATDVNQLAQQIWDGNGQLGRVGVVPTPEYRAGLALMLQALRQRGYDHSGMPDRHICLLTPTVAIVSGHGFRYRADGSILGERGWTSLLVRTDVGWRMGGGFEHDPNTAVTC